LIQNAHYEYKDYKKEEKDIHHDVTSEEEESSDNEPNE